ncbi:MAG: hypothetical protein Q8K38_12925 [Burkholderiaceae bacterium]|nr:hypothetical protein [Burkholderiaceae bacterium]MDZ4146325.1 hypothetical protein [Burkholderiales bacterium]
MAAALATLMALGGGQPTAASAGTPPVIATATENGAVKPNPPKKKKSSKPKIYKGSGETSAERDRRLYRECKGRPNAGACEGYTR